jgi:lysophospholipase L1-like esterase
MALTRRQWIAGGASCLCTQAAAPAGYLDPLIAAMQVEWPRNETLHFVAHGHSVPAGYFKTPDVRTFDSYPHLFHAGLKQRFPHAVLNMIVTAKGGEDSQAGAARFDRDVLALQPRLVTIDYGLNDRGIGLDRARANWSAMIRKCIDRDVKLILLTPTGDSRVANFLDDTELLSRHAAQIRELADEFRLPLVDSHRIFREHIRNGGAINDLLSQVNHPNRAGHERIAVEMLRCFGIL